MVFAVVSLLREVESLREIDLNLLAHLSYVLSKRSEKKILQSVFVTLAATQEEMRRLAAASKSTHQGPTIEQALSELPDQSFAFSQARAAQVMASTCSADLDSRMADYPSSHSNPRGVHPPLRKEEDQDLLPFDISQARPGAALGNGHRAADLGDAIGRPSGSARKPRDGPQEMPAVNASVHPNSIVIDEEINEDALHVHPATADAAILESAPKRDADSIHETSHNAPVQPRLERYRTEVFSRASASSSSASESGIYNGFPSGVNLTTVFIEPPLKASLCVKWATRVLRGRRPKKIHRAGYGLAAVQVKSVWELSNACCVKLGLPLRVLGIYFSSTKWNVEPSILRGTLAAPARGISIRAAMLNTTFTKSSKLEAGEVSTSPYFWS